MREFQNVFALSRALARDVTVGEHKKRANSRARTRPFVRLRHRKPRETKAPADFV